MTTWERLWFGPLNGVRIAWWRLVRGPARRARAHVHAQRLRIRPAQYVVWGGRDVDVWIGSPEDLFIARRLKRLAASRRAMQTWTGQMQQIAQAFTRMGEVFAQSVERMRPGLIALGKAMQEYDLSARYAELYDQKG